MSPRRGARQDAVVAPHHMTAEQRACSRLLRDAEKWITDAHRLMRQDQPCADSIRLAQTALQAALEESNANPG